MLFNYYLTQRVMWAFAITLHQLSVVCKLFTVQCSPLKLLGQLETNLWRIMNRRSTTRIPHLFLSWQKKNMASQVIVVSVWPIYQNYSPLKLLSQLEPNFTGMMLRRSSTRFPLFVLNGQKTWQIYAFLFSIGQEKKSFLCN